MARIHWFCAAVALTAVASPLARAQQPPIAVSADVLGAVVVYLRNGGSHNEGELLAKQIIAAAQTPPPGAAPPAAAAAPRAPATPAPAPPDTK